MTGDWFTLGGETEEHWLAPLGDVMIGMGRTRAEGRTTFHEFMRIEMDGSTPVFYAYPNGKAPVPFRLLEGSTTKAVFANPEHDDPKRIVYEREGEGLRASTEGAKPQSDRMYRR
jgi:hypothetical protein